MLVTALSSFRFMKAHSLEKPDVLLPHHQSCRAAERDPGGGGG